MNAPLKRFNPDDPAYSCTLPAHYYYSPDIYRKELEVVFARSWNFACHLNQVEDPGRYVRCYAGEEEIVVDSDDGGTLTIPYGETATLRLAYAISVHKAQGSEVPVVVGVCHRAHTRMLTRALLYTAITRARNTCVLVGDTAALAAAVRRDDSGGRYSGLAERLLG